MRECLRTFVSKKTRSQTPPEAVKVPKTVSFSRLTSYDSCSEYYRLAHVERVFSQGDTDATRLGGIVHEALEQYYLSDFSQTPFQILAGQNGVLMQLLEKDGLMPLMEPLSAYSKHCRHLRDRASAGYTGPDPIRKADGGLADKPQMTTAWKRYAAEHQLDAAAAFIDRQAKALSPRRWTDVSLSYVFTEALHILRGYKHDPRLATIVAVELEFSEARYVAADEDGAMLRDAEGELVTTSRMGGEHPLWMNPETNSPRALSMSNTFWLPKLGPDGHLIPDPEKPGDFVRRDDLAFMGYIDLIGRNADGKLIVVDHKTSKMEPDAEKVERHEQLLLYGLMVELQSGEAPHQVGISHLRSGKLVLGRYRRDKAVAALERLLQVHAAIEKQVFVRQHPDAFGNACVRVFGGKVNACPGLQFCHPDVFAGLQAA